MGASTAWLAVKGMPRSRILETLGLQIAASPGDARESGLQGSDFSSGWYVIAAGGYGNPIIDDENLKRVSMGCEVVAGGADTRVMCSTACGWKDGREVWWVDHDSENGVEDLRTRGVLPPAFTGIHDELQAEQQAEGPDCGVDFIFSAPEKLTQALTGYHYDEAQPGEEWRALVPAPKMPWWKRLF
jgi:hypothetical protein